MTGSLVAKWMLGKRRPGPKNRLTLERLYGIACDAWDQYLEGDARDERSTVERTSAKTTPKKATPKKTARKKPPAPKRASKSRAKRVSAARR